MLILNRKPGESVHIDDWDTTHIITFVDYNVKHGAIGTVRVNIDDGQHNETHELYLGEFFSLRSDISFKFDCLTINATQSYTGSALKMLIDLPPKDSARAVSVVRSELLFKSTG